MISRSVRKTAAVTSHAAARVRMTSGGGDAARWKYNRRVQRERNDAWRHRQQMDRRFLSRFAITTGPVADELCCPSPICIAGECAVLCDVDGVGLLAFVSLVGYFLPAKIVGPGEWAISTSTDTSRIVWQFQLFKTRRLPNARKETYKIYLYYVNNKEISALRKRILHLPGIRYSRKMHSW